MLVLITFSHPPKRILKQKRDDIAITYYLDSPVTWSDNPERVFKSRNRKQIAAKLNEWLAECSRYRS